MVIKMYVEEWMRKLKRWENWKNLINQTFFFNVENKCGSWNGGKLYCVSMYYVYMFRFGCLEVKRSIHQWGEERQTRERERKRGGGDLDSRMHNFYMEMYTSLLHTIGCITFIVCINELVFIST